MFVQEVTRVSEAVEALAVDDVEALPDSGPSAEVAELSKEIDGLRAQLARRVAVWDGRVAWAADGQRSPAAWLAHHTGYSRAQGRELVRVARRLRELPALRAAVEVGELSWEQTRTLALAASEESFQSFKDVESVLVESCRDLSVAETRRVAQYWRHLAAPDDETALAEAHHRGREVFVSKTFEGTFALHGSLDADGGRTVEAALHRMIDAGRARERGRDCGGNDSGSSGDAVPIRTTSQHRADALVDMARLVLGWDPDRDDTDEAIAIDGTSRHHVDVVVDADTLVDDTGVLAEYGDGSPMLGETARRYVCDGGVFRVLTTGASLPLDVGRQTRVPNRGIRRALVFRDGGCCFPGCDVPARLCDVHHLIPWSHGGPTGVTSCPLLCWFHHRLVHEGGWTAAMDPTTARPAFAAPDGRQFHATNPRQPLPCQLRAA